MKWLVAAVVTNSVSGRGSTRSRSVKSFDPVAIPVTGLTGRSFESGQGWQTPSIGPPTRASATRRTRAPDWAKQARPYPGRTTYWVTSTPSFPNRDVGDGVGVAALPVRQ